MVFSRVIASCIILAASFVFSSCGTEPAPEAGETAPPATVTDSAAATAESPTGETADAVGQAPDTVLEPAPVALVEAPRVALIRAEDTPLRTALTEALATGMQSAGIPFEHATVDLLSGGGAQKLKTIADSGVTSILLMADALNPSELDVFPAGVQRIALLDPLPIVENIRFIGPDHTEAGKAAGILVQGSTPPMLRIVVCCRRRDTAASIQRVEGLQAQLSSTGQAIYQILEDGGDPTRLSAMVADMVSSHPEVACLVSLEANQSEAVVQGLKDAGRLGQVHLVCAGTSPSTLAGIEAGYIDGTVEDMGSDWIAAVVGAVRERQGDDITIAPVSRRNSVSTGLPGLPQ